MEQITTKLNERGRLVIPAAYRKLLGIKPGDSVVMRIEDNELRISGVMQALERARRLIRDHVPAGESLSESLIKDRRFEAARE